MVAFHTPERPTTATPQPAPRHNATPSDSATAPGVPCYTIPRDVRTAKKSYCDYGGTVLVECRLSTACRQDGVLAGGLQKRKGSSPRGRRSSMRLSGGPRLKASRKNRLQSKWIANTARLLGTSWAMPAKLAEDLLQVLRRPKGMFGNYHVRRSNTS